MGKKRASKNKKQLMHRICGELAEQYSHRDNVPYETMYNMIKRKYGQDPPATASVLRLCARLDRTKPPVLQRGGSFSDFLRLVIERQKPDNHAFSCTWRARNRGSKIKVETVSDLTMKSYSMICYNDEWRRMWKNCDVKPLTDKYREYDYKLGTYIGAWADYEGC
jgi:hypothetical protein